MYKENMMSIQPYSVLISVYYREKPAYFDQALNSIVMQTEMPDEIVVVRDGPLTPELDEVLQRYDRDYPGLFRILTNEKNLGLGPSLARGVEACRNELIARMDSDDISRPDRMEKQLNVFLDEPETAVCGGAIREFNGDDINDETGFRICPETNDELKTYMKKRCPFNHMTVMYKRSEVLRAGNYKDFLYNEDYLLWIDMAKAGCVFRNLKDVLVDVRTDDQLYSRRGGDVYFRSEKSIQDILLKEGIITRSIYAENMAKRIILQKLMPNRMRSFIYKHIIRSKHTNEETQ